MRKRSMRESHTRRAVVLGAGTALVGMSALAVSTQEASATIAGDFEIKDGSIILADQSLSDIQLGVDATYSYSSNAPLNGHRIQLQVGSSASNLTTIADVENDHDPKKSHKDQTSLSGSVLDGPFDMSDFEPTNGELSSNVTAKLILQVIREGETVLEDSHTEQFSITVNKEELTVEGTMSGTGEVTFVKE